MLHLATLNGPKLMEMIASVVRDEAELLVILMGREVDSSLAGLLRNCSDASATERAAVALSESEHSGYAGDEECFRCEVETGLATLIVSESVISDENKRSYRDNEGTGNDTGGLPSLREPNDHAPNAPETESRDGGELRLLIEEAGCGLAHRTLPDEMYSCDSERQSIREIESDDDDSGDGESNGSSRRTSVSALTLPTVFRAPTRDAEHVSPVPVVIQESSFIPFPYGIDEHRRPKPFLYIELCNRVRADAEAARSESGYGLYTVASSNKNESDYSADMSGRADSRLSSDMGGRADSRLSLESASKTKELDVGPSVCSEGAVAPSACSRGAQPRNEANVCSRVCAQAEDRVSVRESALKWERA